MSVTWTRFTMIHITGFTIIWTIVTPSILVIIIGTRWTITMLRINSVTRTGNTVMIKIGTGFTHIFTNFTS